MLGHGQGPSVWDKVSVKGGIVFRAMVGFRVIVRDVIMVVMDVINSQDLGHGDSKG